MYWNLLRMLNNDYLKGYIAALNNISKFLEDSYKNTPEYHGSNQDGFFITQEYIKQVKENYKQLVKDLNESQSKKTK